MNKWAALTAAFALLCVSAYAGEPYADSDTGKAIKNKPPLTGSALEEYRNAYEARFEHDNTELIKARDKAIDYMEKAGLIKNAADKAKLKTAELVVYEDKDSGDTWRNPGSGETRPMSTSRSEIVVDKTYMDWVMASDNEEAKNHFYSKIAHELTHFALREIGGIQKQDEQDKQEQKKRGNLEEAVCSIAQTRVYNVASGKNLDVVNAGRTGYADLYLSGDGGDGGYVIPARHGYAIFGKNFSLDQIHGEKGDWPSEVMGKYNMLLEREPALEQRAYLEANDQKSSILPPDNAANKGIVSSEEELKAAPAAADSAAKSGGGSASGGASKMNTTRLKQYKTAADTLYNLAIKAHKNPQDSNIDDKKREAGWRCMSFFTGSDEEREQMRAYSNELDEKLEKQGVPSVFNLP